MISSKLGSLLTSSTDLLDNALTATTDVEFEYDDDNGLTILSDSVDKLRKQLKEQYLISIGLQAMYINSYNVCDALNRKTVVDTEDYNDIYNRIVDYDFSLRFANREIIAFNKSDFDYAYFDGNQLRFISHDLKLQDYPFHSLFYSCDKDDCFVTFWKKDNGSYYSCYGGLVNSGGVMWSSSYSDFHSKSSDLQFYIFRSYEAVYNYVKGSQTAYVSSEIEETGKDIQISIDDMNTNISDKMDELIDTINNNKGSMSADELQNAIDKGLESISGKIDDIGDNTEQTNNKLDDLISIMREQNIILSDILGVTHKIADSVADDKDEKTYTISDIIPHFNKCFTAVKNMVLFGTSSFDDTGTQSVMSVDNDVGIAVYADDVEDNVKDYHNGILGKFPFSVPYQLYEWLQVLQCEPKTPEFKYNYGYLVGKKDSEETIIQFDLSNYNDWANVSRSFLKLSFTLALAVGVYRKFKGEI